MVTIAIDAGHGYDTPGKRTPDGIREWSLNSKVAEYMTEYLRGYVQVIRTDDVTGKNDVALSARRKKAITAGAALISIHHNAASGSWGKATGVETYYHTTYGGKQAQKLARIMQARLAAETGLRNRGMKNAKFTVIATGQIPAVLCEGGFMDGETDSAYIRTEAGQRAYARAAAEGILEYFGIEKKAEQEEEEMKLYKHTIEMPDWAIPSARKAIERGIISVSSKGEISVYEPNLQVIVWMDRMGMLG